MWCVYVLSGCGCGLRLLTFRFMFWFTPSPSVPLLELVTYCNSMFFDCVISIDVGVTCLSRYDDESMYFVFVVGAL